MNELISSSEPAQSIINGFDVIMIFGSMVLLLLIILFIKKMWYRKVLKKRYYIFPKLSVKGIANVSMVIAASVAVLILITLVTAGFMAVIFRAYPGWRVVFEGVLVKIGGLMFGPIIGIFIGGVTDLLAVSLTAGAFHYGFFIVAMMYGFISGLIRTLWIGCKNREIKFAFWASIIAIFSLVLTSVYILLSMNGNPIIVTIFIQITFTPWVAVAILIGLFAVVLFSIWLLLFIFKRDAVKAFFLHMMLSIKYGVSMSYFETTTLFCSKKGAKYITKKVAHQSKNFQDRTVAYSNISRLLKKQGAKNEKNWLSLFLQVIFMVLITETISQVIFLPVYDVEFSASGFEFWLGFRILMVCVMIPSNLILVYPIYKVISSIVVYSYTDNLIEDLSMPVYIK